MLLVMMAAFGPQVRIGLPHFSIIIPGMEIRKKSKYSMYVILLFTIAKFGIHHRILKSAIKKSMK